ncbi:EAL domain-containing protein [Gallaecimonas kandeliae]|uniref:EAL domain-containing protein n=1 Tax=Gallaecimonas kandeliae TaxID=3029055 RepID=UPI002647D346|nr:EAL domain-containing protein [Gallaecimonas kandeliae]WKE66240.1 EAL domain-containing protein [Gallaecimonas kandeliae]
MQLGNGVRLVRRHHRLLLLLAVLVLAAAPTLSAFYFANQQGLEAERDQVLHYAREALRRSDAIADQIYQATDKLEAAGATEPCSAANLALMRKLDLAASYIQALGFVADDQLKCSSLGGQEMALPLGPAAVVTSTGSAIRYHVLLPQAPGTRFTVVQRGLYAALVHSDIAIDTDDDEPGLALAIFTPDDHRLRTSRGQVSPGWPERLTLAPQQSFIDQGYLVALVRSPRYATVALAALPLSYAQARSRDFMKMLLPISLVAGFLLVMATLYLARQQLSLQGLLRAALKRREFFLQYQPVVELETGRVVGAEALVRWRRPNGDFMAPHIFIPAAEAMGLIHRITAQVMEQVAEDAEGLFRGHPDFHLAINLSSQDLHRPETLERLKELVEATGASPGNLVVEATESGFLNADQVRQLVQQIREQGIQVAIDDFGTGYSSLAYLERFDIDSLKIDKSFVETIGTEAPTSQVVTHIIDMAKALKLEMVAEGVESQAQADFLKAKGVRLAQGWLFGKPMAFKELLALLERRD